MTIIILAAIGAVLVIVAIASAILTTVRDGYGPVRDRRLGRPRA